MKQIPEWKRQSIVRALVMGDLTQNQIAVECGVSRRKVQEIKEALDEQTLDTCASICAYASNG